MTPLLLRLDQATLDPVSAERLAVGDAVGVMLPVDAADALAAAARQVRAEAAQAVPEGIELPPLLAVELDAWTAAGEAASGFDIASHVAELVAGGEPLEVLLAAVATGRSLVDAGLNAVLGPDLSTLTIDPEAVAMVLGSLVEGLQATGIAVGLQGLPLGADAGDPRWRPWGTAFAAGLDWLVVDGAADGLAPTLTVLRDDLGFDGLVVASGPAPGVDLTLVGPDAATTLRPSTGVAPELLRRVAAWRLDVLD